MSTEATAWAWKERTGSFETKAVLVALAEAHDPVTGLSHAPIDRIADDTEMDYQEVREALALLQARDFIMPELGGQTYTLNLTRPA